MATASPKGRKTSSSGFRGKEDVVLAILQRELGGASIRANAVKADDRPLFVAAIRLFRIWREALRAAGIKSEAVSGKRQWTPNLVLRLIRNTHLEGTSLNFRSVRKVDQSLVQAARKLWGSWDNALLAAGYNPLDEVGGRQGHSGTRNKWSAYDKERHET
jgi:hypothetical protein